MRRLIQFCIWIRALTIYVGDFDSLSAAPREAALTLEVEKEQDEHRDHVMAYVDRFRYKAPRPGKREAA